MWIHALVNTSFHPSFLINFSHPKKITIETKKEGARGEAKFVTAVSLPNLSFALVSEDHKMHSLSTAF